MTERGTIPFSHPPTLVSFESNLRHPRPPPHLLKLQRQQACDCSVEKDRGTASSPCACSSRTSAVLPLLGCPGPRKPVSAAYASAWPSLARRRLRPQNHARNERWTNALTTQSWTSSSSSAPLLPLPLPPAVDLHSSALRASGTFVCERARPLESGDDSLYVCLVRLTGDKLSWVVRCHLLPVAF